MRRTIFLIWMFFSATSTFACRDCNPDYRWTLSGLGGEYGLLGWNDGGTGTLIISDFEIFLPVSTPIAAGLIGLIAVLICAAFINASLKRREQK